MHLLDWAGYQAPSAPTPPVFLAPTHYVVKNSSSDPQLGLRVRASPNGGTTEVLALLPRGCTVILGETSSTNPRWKKLQSVVGGAAIPSLPTGAVGWVYSGELTSDTVGEKAKDTEPSLTLSHQGLNVRREGKGTGAIIGVLPRGAMLKVGEKQPGGYCKVLEVMEYCGVPALPNGPDGKPLGYVYFDELEAQRSAPHDLGQVYPLPAPHPIKAGELIGHMGLYQDQDESGPKPRLHLEVFSCDDVPAFITESRKRVASLPNQQRTLLKIHKGASKLIPHNDAINSSNPPKTTDAGITVGVEMIIPISVLENLPTERKIQVSEAIPGTVTPRITRWWRLDNLLADEAGNRISGWLAEQDLITTRHSPWEWEGFDLISETACAADHLACHLAAKRLLTEEEKPDYQAQISTADRGPIKERLYDIIDGADGSVRDDILSVDELQAALKNPWHAQSISRLITYHESEWLWEEEKWNELDKLMGHAEDDPNPQWVEEKKRVKSLSWWKNLVGKHGIEAESGAWHFQPMSIVSTFIIGGGQLIDVERFIEKYTILHSSFAANTPALSKASAENLRTIVVHINKFYKDTANEANLFELAYMFATARHESYYFPTAEFFSSKPEVGNSEYFNKYDPVLADTELRRKTAMANENTQEGDGFKYRGRGLVHLTWKINYRKAKEHFNIDFVTRPEEAAEPEHSVPIMIWGMKEGIFTGKKLSDYINSSEVDYMNARNIINPKDKLAIIVDYAQKFEHILRETSSAKETFTL